MEPTAENVKIVSGKLTRFRNWPGFPKGKEETESRVRLLCKLVRNQTNGEILREAGATQATLDNSSLPLETNDLDWLLDSIEETMDVFPSQAALRRAYSRYFTAPNEQMCQAAAADFAGETW